MNLTELRDATKQFDKDINFEDTKPLSPTNRRKWQAIQRGVAARKNDGREQVSIQLDAKLLERSDQFAQTHGMSRSELIERSLKSALAFAE